MRPAFQPDAGTVGKEFQLSAHCANNMRTVPLDGRTVLTLGEMYVGHD
jgi:hypothetical protein